MGLGIALSSASVRAADFTVSDGAALRSALSVAAGGDTIHLQAGSEFVGPFTLPQKNGTAWITLQTTDCPTPSLPPRGTRVAATDAICMPRLVPKKTGTLSTSDIVIAAAPGAARYRFVGLELYTDRYITTFVRIGDWNETSISALPHSFIFERLYVHAASPGARRGIALNGGNGLVTRRPDGTIDWSVTTGGIQILDSYFGNIVDRTYESQAVAGWNGVGPFRLENNYFEASGENAMFGGADPSIPNLIPSDIEIVGNYLKKPLEWKTLGYVVKNLFELKNAQRVLIRGNVFENNWIGADQQGGAIVLTPRNQDGASPWSTVRNIDFVFNKVLNSPQGLGILGHDDIYNSERTENITIRHNFFDLHRPDVGGRGRLFQISHGAYHVTIDHNTGFQDRPAVLAYDLPNELFSFTNNLVRHNVCAPGSNLCGVAGDGAAVGDATIAHYFPNGIFRQNVMFTGGSAAAYATTQLCSIDGFPATVSFASDGSLAAGSPYRGRGVTDAGCGGDGLDIGADMTTLNALADTAVRGTTLPPLATPTETSTSIVTATATPTRTSTPTLTRTSTATATPTLTRSVTPSQTATTTRTATPSSTITPTRTATATSISTATPSRTAVATATPSPTSSATPSPTPSFTATATSTVTPTVTPTSTGTASPIPVPCGPVFDVNGDGECDALIDGLLVVRWRLGITGQTLIDGATTVDCRRCTPQEVEDHLQAHAAELEIDGDAHADPLIDGLLVLRWLFGIRGEALIDGVVDPATCTTRCTAAQIEAYLAGLS